jgi:hypothetical protein
MTMSEPWITIGIVLAIGFSLVLLVRAVFAVFPRVSRIVTRTFWCPFKERDVAVEFQEDPWSDRRIDVDRCDAFAPPTAVTCSRLCLHLATLPPAHRKAAARVLRRA